MRMRTTHHTGNDNKGGEARIVGINLYSKLML